MKRKRPVIVEPLILREVVGELLYLSRRGPIPDILVTKAIGHFVPASKVEAYKRALAKLDIKLEGDLSERGDITMRDEFSVCQFFNDDTYEIVREHVSVEEAVAAFQHYTNNVATHLGIVSRVIITDDGDCIVREWEFGKGVVFPSKDATT